MIELGAHVVKERRTGTITRVFQDRQHVLVVWDGPGERHLTCEHVRNVRVIEEVRNG